MVAEVRLGNVTGVGFLEKTLAGTSESLGNAMEAEEMARRKGLLQAIDPRIKLVSFVSLILTISLVRHWELLALFCLLGLALAMLSSIPPLLLPRRSWLPAIIFSGVVALPALFNFITPGKPLLSLAVGPFEFGVTEQGLRTASTLVLRATASVSLAVVLLLTTPWTGLLKALRVLRVPAVLVGVMAMTHRYIYLLLRTANGMFLSWKSRSVSKLDSAEQRRRLGAAVGTLMDKSYHLSDQVHLAMLSRGYRGEVVISDNFHLKASDALALVLAVLAAAGMLLADHIL